MAPSWPPGPPAAASRWTRRRTAPDALTFHPSPPASSIRSQSSEPPSPSPRCGELAPRTRFTALVLVILLTTLLLACSDDKPDPTPTLAPTDVPTAATPPPTATPAPAPTLAPPPAINWRACSPYECAEFSVPIDYTNPARGDFKLALLRLPARNQAAKIGPLLLNPGGPGGSAVDFLRSVAFAIPTAIRDRFDLVAFDPRGVAGSSPILCGDDIQDLLGLDPDPATDAEWQAILDKTAAFADLCAQRAGASLDFYGTENVARDMDRIRQALGEDKLSYLGYSYGTSIGQVYADLFPQHVRAMVLDGALDNSLDADQRNLEQILAFEAALGRFMQFCRERRCFATEPEVALRTLLDRAEAQPIAAPGQDRPLGEGEVIWGVLGSLYSRSQWNDLSSAMSDALNGDGGRMVRLVDRTWNRRADGSYDNFFEANSAVNCIDQTVNKDPNHHRQLIARFGQQAPFFGTWGGYLNLTCALWDAKTSPLRTPKATGAPPILVIGNTGDPATPLKWATALSQQLESAVLLTNDAEGHTAYLQGDACIERAVNAYLLDLNVPSDGARCGSAGIQPVPPLP